MTNYLLFPDGKNKALTLSYDDGVDTDREFIKLLEKYGIKCTFNLCPGCCAPEGYVRPEGKNHYNLPLSELSELYRSPVCEVATHAYTHPRLDLIPTLQCMYEIADCRKQLEEIFGTLVRGHAYPYGSFNDDVIKILEYSGIEYARTTVSTHDFSLPDNWLKFDTTCHHNDPKLGELTDRFLNSEPFHCHDGWLFYLWGHTYEFRRDGNWDMIEDFFKRVSGRENIWYATNIEVCEYVKAYRALVYYADGKRVYNPTQIDVWAKLNDKKVFIPAGQTVEF